MGTIEASAIWPASLLIVRHRLYEVFLTLHHILAVLFLVGFYYHIWYCYNYNWGYEIWAFIAIAIWAINRLWRLARMALKGVRTTVVTALRGTDGEYLRIEIGGVHTHGVVYLCFPALSWMFWENHSFSVTSSFAGGRLQSNPNITMKPASPDPEKSVSQARRTTTYIDPGRGNSRICQSLSRSTTASVETNSIHCPESYGRNGKACRSFGRWCQPSSDTRFAGWIVPFEYHVRTVRLCFFSLQSWLSWRHRCLARATFLSCATTSSADMGCSQTGPRGGHAA